MSVNALQQVGDEIFLGGQGNNGGTLGKYQIESGAFSDLSYLLPKLWCPVSTLAYGANQLFIGGGSREGCAALLSPTSAAFRTSPHNCALKVQTCIITEGWLL
jgi:hypothetical protein